MRSPPSPTISCPWERKLTLWREAHDYGAPPRRRRIDKIVVDRSTDVNLNAACRLSFYADGARLRLGSTLGRRSPSRREPTNAVLLRTYHRPAGGPSASRHARHSLTCVGTPFWCILACLRRRARRSSAPTALHVLPPSASVILVLRHLLAASVRRRPELSQQIVSPRCVSRSRMSSACRTHGAASSNMDYPALSRITLARARGDPRLATRLVGGFSAGGRFATRAPVVRETNPVRAESPLPGAERRTASDEGAQEGPRQR